MIHRNWRNYQDALAAYNAARTQHEAAVQHWNQKLASFDKDSSQAESVNGCGCFSRHRRRRYLRRRTTSPTNTGAGSFCGFVSSACIRRSTQKFEHSRSAASRRQPLRPQFLAEEPTYEPPTEQYAPPPRTEPPPPREPPPPPRKTVTLDSALSTLGLTRTATLEDLKRAYREYMRDYHPDRVAHLGADLKDLAERKAKEINAAYEYLRTALQSRTRP